MNKMSEESVIYNLNGCEYKNDFYDEVETKLCGGLGSGFGRNYDALVDVFGGGFGKLGTHVDNKEHVIVNIKKSKLLSKKMIECINCGKERDSSGYITVNFYNYITLYAKVLFLTLDTNS